MNSKDALIDKILSDAKERREENIADANERKQSIEETADNIIKDETAQNQSYIKTCAEEIIERKITVAKIDCNKLRLKAKRKILDDVFSNAVVKIKSSGGYDKFIEKLIFENAEDGDEVIISESDEKVIGSGLVLRIAEKKKIKLSVSKIKGKFNGGVILSQNGCDKNLTLEVILRELRDELEPEISRILFEVDYAE